MDAPRPGAARTIGDDVIEAVVVDTLETAPADATHWSTSWLAAKHGISRQTVSEIWRAFGLKPWREDAFKVSPDPELVEKIRDIVGLYINPPVAAAVFAVDEKPQIQALNRTAPTLPMLPTTPARATHDYERNGTCDLFAALNIATGKVITDIKKTHTSADFLAFLNKIDATCRRTSMSRWCSTIWRRTRPRRCTGGCCATGGSTSTSRRPTVRG